MSLGLGPKGERLYRCRAKHASGKCPKPATITTSVVEGYVENMVLTEIDGIAKIVPDSGERDRVLEELAQARSDLDGFRRDRAARRKLGAEWHDWLDTYLGAVHELEGELEQIDQRMGAVRAGLTRDHYLALPLDDRREVLAGFIDCVMVRRSRGRGRNIDPTRKRVRVLWRGQGPSDLPRRRVVNEIRSFDFGEDHVEARVSAAEHGA
jgi:hypothetical protein